MAKRRSKQDVGAKQDAPLFDYSPAEWSEIEAAARAILPDGEPLPNAVRERLVEVARRYRADISLRPWPKDRCDWQKIVQLSERLHQAFSVVIEEGIDYYNIVGRPQSAEGVRRWRDGPLKAVLQIKLLAKDRLLSESPMLGRDRPPRVWFQDEVLNIWIYLGGKLRFSRHPKTKRPQGPLIRFFRAVTTPVLGASAASLESLPEIIRRRKKIPTLEAWMEAYARSRPSIPDIVRRQKKIPTLEEYKEAYWRPDRQRQ
jgi:hypothetical protein